MQWKCTLSHLLLSLTHYLTIGRWTIGKITWERMFSVEVKTPVVSCEWASGESVRRSGYMDIY